MHQRSDCQFDGHMNNKSADMDACDYNMDQQSNANQFKTFYNKSTLEAGPYATTAILNNMPERDESQIPHQSPPRNFNSATLPGSTESSCTDNNAATHSSSGEHSGSQEKRSSTPVLPSFSDLLPPPPQYPPPTYRENQPLNPISHREITGKTMPAFSACHTCKRPTLRPGMMYPPNSTAYNSRTFAHPIYAHHPPVHNAQVHPSTAHQYHHIYPTSNAPTLSGSASMHSYQSYHRGAHSSDSHDYAEPTFELQRDPIYGGCPPITHQAIPPPHLLHHKSVHHAPVSDEDGGVCPSCADQTEYEEPWGDQPWFAWPPDPEFNRLDESEALLAAGTNRLGDGSETQSQGSHGTNKSRSESEDSRTDRQRARRRQRAQQLPARSSSPYNGYSTDSSAVFVPRKPYPKSQRRKQMSNKSKSAMKSLAVQVEQEEIPLQQDKV